MNKTEQLKNKVENLENQLKEAKLELRDHLSKTIYFTCPKCYKKTSLAKLIYFEVETCHPSYNSYDDDRYMKDGLQIVCPSCEHKQNYTKNHSKYYTIPDDKYKYYNEKKNLFKAVVEVKGYK
jgi:hypothetical protein